MRTIFEACVPRPEVLSGELRDDLFAASLASVVLGTAEPVYQDPERFFSQTYPTMQLRTFLREALGRLTGSDPSANGVLLLETPFGGGKTHALIALYHAARGERAAARVVGEMPLPERGSVSVAAVVGTDLDPTQGVPHPEVTTYTLWGELAYQLGGPKAYRLVEESDHRTKAAPGRATLEQLFGERPVLILLDELARYVVVAEAVPTATGKGTLADQTIAFLHALLEFAAARRNVLVVLTMASSTDAFAEGTERLREALSVIARSARLLTPAEPEEIPAIVVHRLFEYVDQRAAEEVAQAYLEALRRWDGQKVSLPPAVTMAEYAERIARSYPFHPELVQVLDTRVGSIPNFQRTRGALRLLARVVRRLWNRKPPHLWLIHPADVDLGDPDILEDLTNRLDRPAFKQVAEADIASRDPKAPSHAEAIDLAYGDLRPAQRLATTIFLHSLASAGVVGIDPPSLLAATLRPNDQPDTLARVLDELRRQCWFLATDEGHHRYWFATEPQLQKIIDEERARVPVTQAKEFICQRIEAIFKPSVLKPEFFPSDPAELPDDADQPRLVILHFDAVTTTADEETVPELVRRLFEQAGQNSFRTYRNNVVFLVADGGAVGTAVERARTVLALDRLLARRDPLLSEQKQQELKTRRGDEELQLRIAILRAYRFLYYPQGDAAINSVPLQREMLPIRDQGTVEKNQTTVIEERLRELEKIRHAEAGKGLPAPALVQQRAFGKQEYLSTVELRRAFARYTGLPILADAANALREIIRLGIRADVWVYYDAAAREAYDAHSGREPSIRLADDTFVYTPEAAERAGLPVVRPGKSPAPVVTQYCPVCGEPTEQCRCAEEVRPRPEQQIEEWIKREGTVGQVFVGLLDEIRDRQLTLLANLTLHLETAEASEVRAFGLWVDQLRSLGQLEPKLEASLTATLGQGGELDLTFTGPPEQYLRYRSLFEAPLSDARHLSARFQLRYEQLTVVETQQLVRCGEGELAAALGKVLLTAQGYRE
ncbi:DUF499 domain-containing protein [Thermomicrobium sp. CFH 73360]|uniref:ATP-binding protein n=1 Tax=Thermomicrobium sp. CFH 73360 TaxID=2951987 RepID=UPI0020776EC1|nr:DUF499 domain-containing protein [Thermomicrobium sp. CFH 73360]MCM8747172.1 DUF499 domain-containing protein [Thermomicrobium sp. CFH 73360]